jgi:putative acetyltransferase
MITLADLADAEVRDLIAYHQRAMVEGSPPGHSFALDLTGLQAADVTLWAAHVETRVAAIGALKRLDDARGEGLRVLSLETGSGPAFEPALALYRRRGFVNGEAFADYALTDFNQCLHLHLA